MASSVREEEVLRHQMEFPRASICDSSVREDEAGQVRASLEDEEKARPCYTRAGHIEFAQVGGVHTQDIHALYKTWHVLQGDSAENKPGCQCGGSATFPGH